MRKLEPCDGPPAAPSPSPPGRKAGNEVEPPAVFRVAASGSRCWHPRPAPVGDLDPDNVVRRLDRDRDRLARGTRATMPQTIGKKLAHQQGGHVPAGVPGASLALPRQTRGPAAPAPPVPQASRSPGPPAQPSAHPPSRPPRIPGNRAGRRADTCGCTLDSASNVKARQPPERAPEPPSSGYPHRSLAPIPVRYASVDPATQRPTALQDDTPRDKGETPR